MRDGARTGRWVWVAAPAVLHGGHRVRRRLQRLVVAGPPAGRRRFWRVEAPDLPACLREERTLLARKDVT